MLRYLIRHHVGLAALVVALSGTAYAVTSLPANSVGARQLRRGSVTQAKLATYNGSSPIVASCRNNESVVGGGFYSGTQNVGISGAYVYGQGWQVYGVVNGQDVQARVLCAS